MIGLRSEVARLLDRQTSARRLPPILVLGETGTGKGLLARCIHQAGPRREGPFVAVNCAAIPETLIEAELFGYERGAFTDARQAKPGLFQTAHGGMLFLDEIGLLPGPAQGKLLTVLEDRAVRRLGGTRTEAVDVAVVAATSVDLKGAVGEGRFREDLYHRLAVITLTLPPLRERDGDILVLAEHFLGRASADYGLSARHLTPETRARLQTYRWPGNVRELANAMERVALLSESDTIATSLLDFLPDAVASEAQEPGEARGPGHASTRRSLDDALRGRIETALRETGGNIRRTATALGISRNTLRARMDRYGLRQRVPAREPASPAAPPLPMAQSGPVEWARRHLAFLRVGLRTSSSARDPRGALDVLGEKITSFGGRVEEWSPTGVVAVFGLDPVDNPSSHAALAALAIQNAAARARGAGAEGADIVVAIHCAEHLVGRRAAATQLAVDGKLATWAVLEDLVATGAPGTVEITEAVAPFLARRFALQPLHDGERRVSRVLHRLDAAPAANLVPFVGRALELSTLEQAAGRAEHHHGQVVGVVGEAGVGKSRLLHEMIRRLGGWRVLQSAGAPYATRTSYFPIVELLKRHCYIEDADTTSAVRAKVVAALSRGVGDPDAVTPPVLDLLAALPADDPFRLLDPAERRRRTLDAVKRVVLAASAALPLCLIVEDLHWIDPETEAVLDDLVESVPGSRVLLLVNYRPEYRHRWGSKTYYRQLQLDPLSGETAEQFGRALLGADPAVQRLAAHLAERTEGNPFFLEESVKSLVEAGVLGGQRGAYQLTATAPRVEIPSTVQALLSARIDRLPAEDKHILEMAAVIGKTFSRRLLQAITDQGPEALRGGLAALQAAEFIYETTVVPDVEYTFKHALTHEVAYEGLLDARRRALHAAVMDAIIRLHAERLDDHVERLAYHAVRGEVWEPVVVWSRRAAARAASRSAYAQAAVHLEQALAALGHLGPTRTTTEQAVDIRIELRELLVPLGKHRRTLEHLEEALPLAEALGDQHRLGVVYRSLGTAHWLLGDCVRGLAFGQKALALAEEIDDPLLRMRSHFVVGANHHVLGHYRDGARACEATVGLLDEELTRERFGIFPAYARAWLAFCLAALGDFTRASLVAQEAAALARANGRPEPLVATRAALAYVSHLRGDLPDAIEHLESGLALCREAAIGVWLTFMCGHLGHVYALSGRPAEARLLLEECLECTRTQTRAEEALWTAWLGEAHILAGRRDEAQDVATRALDLARQHHTRGAEAVALHVLGEIASSAGHPDPAGAAAHYRAALALAEEIGMRPLVAHCHAGLARLSQSAGDPRTAAVHFATAAELYREMKMAYWLEQASVRIAASGTSSPTADHS